ncbi:MAG TPA: phosphatidate cytidylyltransferase [Microbacteriaceae bacterium]|nr:phosphatidate cytidylyltransferase [Microbacteriaceae bacterium]
MRTLPPDGVGKAPPDDEGRDRPGARHPRFKAQFRATRLDLERQVHETRAQFTATNERIQARTGRNLIGAILIGLGLGAVFLVSLLVVKELFIAVAAVILAVGAFELSGALGHAGRRVPRIPAAAGGLAIAPAAYFGHDLGQLVCLAAAIVVIWAWRLAEALPAGHRRGGRALLLDLGAAVFVQVYVVFLGSFTVLLTARDGGQWWTIGFIVVVVAVDVGAYASGLMFGRHPMAPKISPKKTWEGFEGAAVAALAAGVLLAVFALGRPWWFGLIFGAALLGSATVGDLIESLIKRDIGVKDMSSWLPGHGGFLDRLDSILPSALVAYFLFALS